ncbi:MAG: acetate--CoA ligase family protein [Hyphomicrobiaceae bacterium]
MSAIDRLMRPSSVAVVGASSDPAKTAGRPVSYLVKHGFKGRIYPVNPRTRDISGLACYPDVASLPEAPEVGIVLVGPDRAAGAVRDLALRGAQAAIVLAGGFGETGEHGKTRERELKAAAGAMRLLGPNTIGIVNLVDRIMLSATGALELGDLPAGRISVVSQSGGILGALLSRAADRGVGFAHLISTGNEADLETVDFIEHLIDDPQTTVIALYLEGLRNPDGFKRAARRAAAAGKPMVAFKVGRSEAGARSAVSHTGALAGQDRLYDALFNQLGVIRAETFSDLIDIPAGLVQGRLPAGPRLAVITSTGGAGTLIADACGMLDLELPEPDTATAQRMAALLDAEQAAAAHNPVDVTLAGVKPDVLRAAIGTLIESPSYDAVVAVVGSSALANPHIAADAIADCQSRTSKPLLAFVSPHAPHIVALLNSRGIPAFASPEGCAAALSAMWRHGARGRAAEAAAGPHKAETMALPPLRRGPLNEAEAKALFAHFGIPVTRERIAASPAAAVRAAGDIGARVVLKVLARDIPHKSDVGGVKVGIRAEDVETQAQAMLDGLASATGRRPEGLLVQEQVEGGLEMILGLVRDASLGPAIMLGMGGVAAELVGDTALRLLPLQRADAEAMIAELNTGALLTGYRGAPKRDVEALIEAILAFARMAETLGERLAEAEINPLFVLPFGKGVLAADGLAVLR